MAALLGACLVAGAASAATLTGQITSEDKPLAGAWVQLNTGQVAVADARGRYAFPQVPQATYALQAFAPGKEPAALPEVVPGKGRADMALGPAATAMGLVHVKATTPDGALCPVRLVTRWRAADGAEWQTPADLRWTSTLDGRGQPLVPSEEERSSIVPFGACLWTGGEALLALPPGQAELTCASGVLRRVDQRTVEVKPGEVTEAAVPVMLGSELGGAGWTNGAVGLRIGGGSGAAYLVNIPLAAAICRAEGYDWVSLVQPYGNDPAQTNAKQAAVEASDARLAVWLAPEWPADAWGGTMVAVGPEQPLPSGVPNTYASGLLKRAVALYADPLAASPPPREFAFGLLADPTLTPLLAVPPASAARDEYLALWSQLVERGLRVGCAAVADADLGAGRLPTPERTFVQTDGSLDPAAVVDALRRGATLVTTGPALGLTVGDAGPGDVLAADDATHVAEMDAVLGCVPGGGVSRLELVRSGRVVRTWDVAEVGPNHLQARIAIREREPAWFALRAFGVDGSQAAYTSPVYFADPAAPAPVAREARFSGTVRDAATGEPVTGAKVTATPPGGRAVSTLTDGSGRYGLAAPVISALEVTHPRYPPAPASGAGAVARSLSTTRFAVWDCPDIRGVLDAATREALLTPEFHARLEAALASPTVDFTVASR